MNSNSKIHIGIIGAGSIVRQRHLPGLKRIKDVEIVVVCNQRKETAQQFASEFGIPQVAEKWEEVIQRKDLDAILIGTPPYMHAPISIAALNAGKHVFCQARMTMNFADAKKMLKAAEEHPGQVSMICPPPNGMKHGKYLQKLLIEGYIGNLLHFSLHSLNPSWIDSQAPAHWRQRIELSGNNILSVGIYAEVLGSFFGYAKSVCAQARVCYPQRNGYEVKIPDYIQVLGKWPDGLYGTLEWSGVSMFGPREDLQLYGSEGTIVYDFKTDEIFIGKHGENELENTTVPAEYVRSWTVEEDFIDAIRNKGKPEPSFYTGCRYMRFLEAVHCSLRENRWVNLDTL